MNNGIGVDGSYDGSHFPTSLRRVTNTKEVIMTKPETDTYALARARTQESIERVAKKRKRKRTKAAYR